MEAQYSCSVRRLPWLCSTFRHLRTRSPFPGSDTDTKQRFFMMFRPRLSPRIPTSHCSGGGPAVLTQQPALGTAWGACFQQALGCSTQQNAEAYRVLGEGSCSNQLDARSQNNTSKHKPPPRSSDSCSKRRHAMP